MVNGHSAERLSGNTHLSITGINSEALLNQLKTLSVLAPTRPVTRPILNRVTFSKRWVFRTSRSNRVSESVLVVSTLTMKSPWLPMRSSMQFTNFDACHLCRVEGRNETASVAILLLQTGDFILYFTVQLCGFRRR
ncbi:hypothetical protein Pan258_46060 [Symmachiella dynata]|nr:hypothetical protein Pan258_46060 [Symmachiella dynata]